MSNLDNLSNCRVAIVGLGLMGGSLALALRGKTAGLSGVEIDPQIVALAEEWGVVDRASTQATELLPQADVIILSAPVGAILSIIEQLPNWCAQAAVVIDLGSTKGRIIQAMQTLPERFDPIGGHPMCGKERGSLRHADAGLYQGATFALVALERSSDRARRLAEQLVEAVGARTLWMQAADHDRWVAATSHLPYLIANSLAYCTPAEAQALVGPGLRSSSRVAASPLSIFRDILKTNRENILVALEKYCQHLDVVQGLLAADDWEALESLLQTGAMRYDQIIYDRIIADRTAAK
jgi:prephenate dehydrogenase